MTVKNKYNFTIGISLITMLLLAISCSQDYQVFDKEFNGVYFQKDSIYYSFGVTPIERRSYDLKVPVTIMGGTESVDRSFSASVLSDKSTAKEGVHYNINKDMIIPADSITGYVYITLLRDNLEEDDFKIYLKLDSDGKFTPVYEEFKETLVHFNNKVEPPSWKDWMGYPTWPDYQLGEWNPLTYIKFIELFRGLEQVQPETYKAMVDAFGPDLENVEYGWPWDYDYTMTRYVVIPLYQYFMEENTDLGVTIPKPMGY